MRVVIAAGLVLSLAMLNAAATTQDDAFQKIAHDYVEQYLRANPEDATELGDHRFDGQLTDYSPEARAKDLSTQKEFRDKLNTLEAPPRVHTETAIEQTQGAISLVRDGLAALLDQAPQMKNELAPLQEKTAAALADYKKWLQNDLLPRSDGNFRLGAEKFRKKLRFALASDLSMEEIMKRAQADLQKTQTAIYETALPLYKKYFPNADSATLADKHKVTAAVLDKLAEQHPDDATVVSY